MRIIKDVLKHPKKAFYSSLKGDYRDTGQSEKNSCIARFLRVFARWFENSFEIVGEEIILPIHINYTYINMTIKKDYYEAVQSLDQYALSLTQALDASPEEVRLSFLDNLRIALLLQVETVQYRIDQTR